jgi:RNA polymerase sigma-70 factor (ECF subfamily)
MAELNDAELMSRVRAGDRQAFAALVDRHKDGLVNYLTRLTGCRAKAEDAAQESFIRLYQAADRYREEGRLASYLYRIATNQVRSEVRKERRRRLLTAAWYHDNGFDPKALPTQRILASEIQTRVCQALAKLPLHYRGPLVLHEIEGWSYQAIAQLMGCREGTVKSRIHRGRQQLKRLLEPYWN